MRILIRLIYLPVMLVMFVLMIAVKIVSHISGIAFGILSILFLLAAGLSVLFGYNLPMAKEFLFGAGIIFILQCVIDVLAVVAETSNSLLRSIVFNMRIG